MVSRQGSPPEAVSRVLGRDAMRGSRLGAGIGSVRLLVVDDDPIIRLVARERFEALDFQVVEADGGERGIESFETDRPDLVLLDVEMPGLDGFGVCEAIRSSTAGRHVPILILTGLDDIDSIQNAYRAGATDFVSKPLNWLILEQRVRYMLRASRTFLDVSLQQRRLDEVQQYARLGSWEVDLTTGTIMASNALWKVLGIEAEQSDAGVFNQLRWVHPEDRAAMQRLIDDAIRNQSAFSLDHRILALDGTERIVHSEGRVRSQDDQKCLAMEGFSQDITERRKTEERVHYLAYSDSLTGLANRDAFRLRLNEGVRRAVRTKKTLAVLYLGLDRFNRVNETFGHTAGDTLLKHVAHLLAKCVRESDSISRDVADEPEMFVSRLGSDEFTVLLEGLTDPSDAGQVARRILESLSQPVLVEGREILITASIGIAVWPQDGNDSDSVLRNSDSAMHHAKLLGGAGFQFYQESLNAHALERLELEALLRRALLERSLSVHFQPKLELATGRITGCEALSRWTDPVRGEISPVEFIAVAEAAGLIGELGEAVLRSACTSVRRWQEQGHSGLKLAVNLSPRQLKDEQIVGKIEGILRDTGFDPRLLELEITESALIHNEDRARVVLNELRQLGIQISLDDFGTGFSSLSYLKRFPVESLKIDRSFISGIGQSDEDEAITTAILSMARALELRVVAEGIETEQQRQFLADRGCDEIQGYLISRPLAAEDFARFLAGYRG